MLVLIGVSAIINLDKSACGEQGGAFFFRQPTTGKMHYCLDIPRVWLVTASITFNYHFRGRLTRNLIHPRPKHRWLRTPCSLAHSVAVSRKFDEPRSPQSTFRGYGSNHCGNGLFLASIHFWGSFWPIPSTPSCMVFYDILYAGFEPNKNNTWNHQRHANLSGLLNGSWVTTQVPFCSHQHSWDLCMFISPKYGGFLK